MLISVKRISNCYFDILSWPNSFAEVIEIAKNALKDTGINFYDWEQRSFNNDTGYFKFKMAWGQDLVDEEVCKLIYKKLELNNIEVNFCEIQ